PPLAALPRVAGRSAVALPGRGLVERLDCGNDRFGIGRDRHKRQLQPLPLLESKAAALDALDSAINRTESNGDSRHQAVLERVDRLVYAVLQASGFGNLGNASLKGDSLLGWLCKGHLTHRLRMTVLPQQRHRGRKLRAPRLHHVAHAVSRRGRCHAGYANKAVPVVNSITLDRKRT